MLTYCANNPVHTLLARKKKPSVPFSRANNPVCTHLAQQNLILSVNILRENFWYGNILRVTFRIAEILLCETGLYTSRANNSDSVYLHLTLLHLIHREAHLWVVIITLYPVQNKIWVWSFPTKADTVPLIGGDKKSPQYALCPSYFLSSSLSTHKGVKTS